MAVTQLIKWDLVNKYWGMNEEESYHSERQALVSLIISAWWNLLPENVARASLSNWAALDATVFALH